MTQLDPSIDLGSSSFFPSFGRNRFVNGEMSIDQQNGGGLVTCNASGTRFWTVDGNWFGVGQPAAGVFTLQRLSATPPPGFTNYVRIKTTTADAAITGQFYILRTLWEGYATRDFLWGSSSAKTITVSFWTRASIVGTYSFALTNSTAARFYVATYTVINANTWEFKTITIPGDTVGPYTTDNSQNLVFTIPVGVAAFRQTSSINQWVSSGTELDQATTGINIIQTLNATLDFTGMQMELGTGATPFEYRPFALEVTLCQRLLEKSYDLDQAIGTVTDTGSVYIPMAAASTTGCQYGSLQYKAQKRITPAATGWSVGGTSGIWTVRDNGTIIGTGTANIDQIGPTNFRIRVVSLSGGTLTVSASSNWYIAFGHYVADARL
jgi:hypothetical protein